MKINTRKTGLLIVGSILTILLAIAGYNFRPIQRCDLFEYRYYLSTYEGVTFREALGKTFSFSYLFNIWFWLISKTGDMYLLSATSCLLVYGIYIFIYTDYFIDHKKSFLHYISGLIFIIGNLSFVQIASSMRNFIAIAIASLAIYITPKYKKTGIILVIFATFMHSSIAILIVLFIFYKYRNSILKGKKFFGMLLFIISMLGAFMWGIYNSTNLVVVVEKYARYFLEISLKITPYYAIKKIYSYMLLIMGCIFSGCKKDSGDRNILEAFRFFALVEILLFIIPAQIYSRFFQGMILFMALSLLYNKKAKNNYIIEMGMIASGFLGIVFDSYLHFNLVR